MTRLNRKRMIQFAIPVLALTLGLVLAKAVSAAPAIVIKNDGLCGMLGSDASGNPIFGGIGEVTTSVTNDNKTTITCKGTGIENDSGRGQSYKGFLCGIIDPFGNFLITSDSHATVSASGNATLKCTAPE